MAEEISWDEAVKSGNFVSFEEDKEKKLVLTNHRLEKRKADAPVAAGEIEFVADVLEEDGERINSKDEKLFTTTSKRLKKKLRPIFEDKKSSDQTTITVMKVGESFQTQYSVKEITEDKK